MDINGLWVTGSRDNNLTWYMTDVAFDENVALRSWQIQKDQDQPFVEVADRAEWGRVHFTGPMVHQLASKLSQHMLIVVLGNNL